MRRYEIYCGNFGCPTRQAGQLFPIVGDGVKVWELTDGGSTRGREIHDGELWLCPSCRPPEAAA